MTCSPDQLCTISNIQQHAARSTSIPTTHDDVLRLPKSYQPGFILPRPGSILAQHLTDTRLAPFLSAPLRMLMLCHQHADAQGLSLASAEPTWQ